MKIRDQIRCELARREFWEYCKLMYPTFYKEERTYLKELCNELQSFYEDDTEFMLVNIGPRHGKSFTATNFVAWVLGKNPKEKIISGSYNEDLSKSFSKTIRNTIDTEKIGDNIIYSDIFETRIKFGSAEAKKWQTEQSNQINYLATSPTGTATGFGATFMIIDDLIKNSEEANNSNVLDKQWDFFSNTLLSRREGKKKVLVIMTRWNSKDLAGRILKYVKDNNISYRHINFKTLQDDGTMLCDDIFSYDDYIKARDLMGQDIFSANYQQEPIDLKGVLYTNFMEYSVLPDKIKAIENYTDTADTGSDYLASINYAVGFDNKAYVLDILFTKEPMEITEKQLAEMLIKDRVNWCRIESNNGGRGFSRNVERITRELGNRTTMFKPFHQSGNKQSRILTNSTGVMQNIYFPADWKQRWKEFYNDVSTYQREGKNKNDDAEDMLTGVNETLEKRYVKGGNLSGFRL